MQHNLERDVEPADGELSTAGVLPSKMEHASNPSTGNSWFAHRWRVILRWFQSNTFSPGFLTSPWSHPIFGYLFAILGQVVAVVLIALLIQAFPDFRFPETLVLLVVLLAALGWGVGPSVVTTLAGGILLILLILPPYFSLAVTRVEDATGVALYTCVGLIISILASQVQRAYYRAQTLSARLETIIEAIPDSLVIYDQQGVGMQWNPAARKIETIETPNIPLPDMPEQLDLRNLQGEKLDLEELPLARALRGEIVRNGEMAYKMPVERRDRFVSVSAAPLRDPRYGAIEGAVTITRDITERRSLEQRTRAALDALLEIAQVLVQEPSQADWSENQATSVETTIARRLAELTRQVLGCQRLAFLAVEPETECIYPLAVVGLSPELEQQWWTEQLQQESHFGDGLDATMIAQLRAGQAMQLDLRQPPWRGQHNSYGIRTMLLAAMRTADQVVGLITLDYGGAEHEYAPDEIRLTMTVGRLAALVIERHRLLREREEARASAMALQVANERMDTFIGIAGHELKTPLTSIKGNLQLVTRRLNNILKEGQGEGVVTRSKLEVLPSMLARAERHVNILVRLVSDLVEVSRIQTGKLELQMAPSNLADIVDEVVADYRDNVPDRVIQLNHAEGTVVPIIADAVRVSQVVSNYLSNALKYSEADRPVEVRLEIHASQARVSVCDEGTGLSREQQEHIWERFYRVPGVEVQNGSGVGLGLGLHISRTIIEEQGGHVGVESSAGEGSTFWFTLPLAR
jgi:signal transduction histidine kinase/PAS domain-containing protein